MLVRMGSVLMEKSNLSGKKTIMIHITKTGLTDLSNQGAILFALSLLLQTNEKENIYLRISIELLL